MPGGPGICTAYRFYSWLNSAFNQVLYVAIGVAILGVYKFGSVRMGLESPRYAVPALQWLGASHELLAGADEEVWQTLTDRDRAMIQNLRNGTCQYNASWKQELDLMEEWDSKAELEALYNVYGFAGFTEVLAQRMLQHRYS